ncbi:toprim domain-containing protein [Faucicola boevrei]|uniref:toprim domain-containing protein n=1 Tax=Faucicola boevrei TaxID=346665 RepID=UPI00037DBC62|nr:toprim domain-containing protein [Moraxella boevrei]
MSINDQVITRLNRDYHFKQVGEWLREGICPQCNKKELYTHAHSPKVVKCGRLNKCGYEAHVKELYDDLYKDWSKTYQRTPQNPNATADAYLKEGRGLDISLIKGSYSQESFFDNQINQGTATVRFRLSNDGFWERLIDKADRFKKKANIKYGYKINGNWWQHPKNPKFVQELWIAEGIFDACALAEHGLHTVSTISCVNFPENALFNLKSEYDKNRRVLPKLVIAYDNDNAGRRYTLDFIAKAEKMGFKCVSAQPPYDKYKKLDWNDLHEMGLLTSSHIKQYRYYGDLLTAKTASDAGVIRYLHTRLNQFYFEHQNRTYWFELDNKKLASLTWEDELQDGIDEMLANNKQEEIAKLAKTIAQSSTTYEILNAKLEALYFQRNEITDESWYFVKVTTNKGEKQITVTGDQLSSPSKLKPRLLSVFSGVLWTGNAMQLDILAKRQMEDLKEVKTTDFIGYSKENGAYIFNDTAVKDGKFYQKNAHDYFKIGRTEIKSLANDPILHISTAQADFGWWHNFHYVRGDYGTIVLAWWLGSYFAEQIRAIDRSFPFFELVGQAGAGKSRLLEFCWKLSGREDYEGFDPSKSTKVAVFRNFAQVANLPVTLIEGDRNDENGNSKYQTFEWDSLKDAFNGRSIRSKGVKNNGNDTYSPPFRASIMISQNEEIRASEAMLTRIIHVKLTRDGQTLATKQIVDELDRLPLEITSRFMAHALRNEQAILATYQQKVREYEVLFHQNHITHTRIALNHAQICALVDCLQQHIFGSLMTQAQADSAKNTLMSMAKARVERLQADHPEVERFWSVFEYLQMSRNYVNHKRVDDELIAINLNHFYKIAKLNYQDLADMTMMKRLLKNSVKYKFIDSNVTVRSNLNGYDSIKCWLFARPTT